MRFGSNGSNPSPEGGTPDRDEEGSSPRTVVSSRSRSKSDTRSMDKAIRELRSKIDKKKKAGQSVSEDQRLLEVLLHKKQIIAEQKDYLISIEKADNREAIFEKLIKVDAVVEKYTERYIEGKIGQPEFKIKQDETIKKLRDFLGDLEKYVSLDEVAAKIMGGRKRKDGRPLLRGKTTGEVLNPPLKRPTVKHSPRPQSVLPDEAKPNNRDYRAALMPNPPRERPEIKITATKERPRKKFRERGSLGRKEKNPPLTIQEIERRDLLQKKVSPPKKTGILLKPVRDVTNMSAEEINRTFKRLNLKLPRGIPKKEKTRTMRKMVIDYYNNVQPVRKVTAKTKIPFAPPRTTKKIKLPRRVKARAARRVTVPVAKRAPAKSPIQTDVAFNPYHPEHNMIKKKGRGAMTYMARPLTKTVYVSTDKKEEYDPRPSWDWVPTGSAKIIKDYQALRAELLESISKQSEGNQFTLAHHIAWCHRVLQTTRAKIGKMKVPHSLKPLDAQSKKILAAAMKKPRGVSRVNTTVKRPLIITMTGQIRPGKKAATQPRLLKRVPVEVLETKIPEYYSRIEMIIIPAHMTQNRVTGKGEGRGSQEQRVIRKTPNWNDVPATGFKTTVRGVTTRDVTQEDLETYLGQTYLTGYQNIVHGGADIKISEPDRIYAYQRGVDLRTITGTYLRDPRDSPGAFTSYIITRENIDKALSRGVSVSSTAPGVDADTAEARERKNMAESMNKAKYIYQVATQAKAKLTLIRAGKKTIAKKTETMTMEQYDRVLSGKMEPIAGFTTEQWRGVLKRLQSILEHMISTEASLVNEKNRATMKVNIEQVTKFIENIKKGQVKSPPKIKRRGVRKVVGGAQYMRLRRGGAGGEDDTPSPSTKSSTKSSSKSSSSSSSSSSAATPKSPPKPVKLKIPPRKMNAEETVILKHFEILDLDPTATDAQITKAYRKLAKKVHPDKNTSPSAANKFIRLKESYDFLKQPTPNMRKTIERLSAETKLYNETRVKTPPKAKPKRKSASDTKMKQVISAYLRTIIKKEGNCETVTKRMLKQHIATHTKYSTEKISAWVKANIDGLIANICNEGKSPSETPSSLSDLERELQEELAQSKKKSPSEEKKAKAISKARGGGQETIQQMLQRHRDEAELRKKGVSIPKKYKSPINISKPVKKAYPGVVFEDLFGDSSPESNL